MKLLKINSLTLLFILTFWVNIGFASEKESNAETTPFYQKDMALFFAIINDNYIAKWKKDENGNYFGADDFLTVSLLSGLYWRDWKIAVTYNSITSRKFDFRYDLLSTAISKSYRVGWVRIQPEVGMILKGDLGGNILQNGYHTFRALNKVDFPYSKEKGLAIIAGVSAIWEQDKLLFAKDVLSASVDSRLLTDYAPSRIEPSFGYQFAIGPILQFEILVSGRLYLNKQKEYSEMTRSGILTALNLKAKAYKQLFFDIGFALFPTKNLKNEPRFPKYKHSYLPQFWLILSWNTAWLSLRNYIDY